MAIDNDALRVFEPRPYAEVRRLVRNGDLLLCSATDPFSRAIRWATRSPWSHIALAFRLDSIARVVVLESVEKLGVRAVPLSAFISRTSSGQHPYPGRILLARHQEFARRARPAAMKRLTRFAFDRLGDRFAGGEVLKIAARIGMSGLQSRLTKSSLPKFLGPDEEFICSEYVAKCYEAVGIRTPWDGLGFVAPGDFARDPKVKAIAQIRTR